MFFKHLNHNLLTHFKADELIETHTHWPMDATPVLLLLLFMGWHRTIKLCNPARAVPHYNNHFCVSRLRASNARQHVATSYVDCYNNVNQIVLRVKVYQKKKMFGFTMSV